MAETLKALAGKLLEAALAYQVAVGLAPPGENALYVYAGGGEPHDLCVVISTMGAVAECDLVELGPPRWKADDVG
jgi:hypothetical protein